MDAVRALIDHEIDSQVSTQQNGETVLQAPETKTRTGVSLRRDIPLDNLALLERSSIC
ncbi:MULTISPECIES: hypothetical protein [unclassified Bradyrhizobium]|uniref:hypothetical protein n=1 Tax=unclassified Bradyrhizobium TaxID=2631580 RepID=UPI00247AEC37|nr:MULTISPECIES: hypothetical protein [unclassified Bradyrhizobium]WGS19215.1 hypothetical protein MTX22_33050 [Bradyrhizobium sp. ISRA463]WGS26052.1 hypothetical protein MTX19_30575 [Bradyrhizobium sp. ISRA464]